MKTPLLHQQILLQTEKLRELHRKIMTHAPPVPVAEMEEFIKEIRAFYALALELNTENALQLLNEVQIAANQKVSAESHRPLPVQEIKPPVVPNEVLEPVAIKTDEPKQMTEKELIPSGGANGFHREVTSFANRFEDHQTLGEKIALQHVTRKVSDNIKKHVDDIRSIIGVNEKFQFINVLFKGDSGKYNSVIETINACGAAEEAKQRINEIAVLSSWDKDNSTVRTFIEIVDKRFSV